MTLFNFKIFKLTTVPNFSEPRPEIVLWPRDALQQFAYTIDHRSVTADREICK